MFNLRYCGECLGLIERRLEESGINCINEDFVILTPHWMLLFLSNEGTLNGQGI